ncbi:short-chain dehydrogenase [Thioclava sp. L04-15]|uniref:NnrS family protein n=1 Tax=Thioclava sp. L04-15 TaxID=1915318 RepID=UPI0009977DC7|nr:NnrS family protein [Thioclava sp. L04-15]OOY29489.1 short-chain dehydrogenase [Thioclava sp. L04-15]TNE83567.1 MAG: NnrS family protein [Paracoccaceae bacterium]
MSAMKRLFGEGFRVFFLAAGIWALVSILVWGLYLGIHAAGGMLWDLPFTMAPHLWHGHEMIFGYGTAAMAGFFLTAVPNWTGAQAARHAFIASAAALWLAGRAAVWYSAALPDWLVAAICLGFLPILGAKLAMQLVKRPKPQNMMFLGLITLLWLGEWRVQLDWMGLPWGDAEAGLRGGLYALVAMIAVLGGRVTPAFTRNAIIRESLEAHGHEPAETALPEKRAHLEKLAIIAAIATAIGALAGLPDFIEGTVMLVFGLAQMTRMIGWKSGFAMTRPILAALHLAMALTGLGALLGGLALLGFGSEIGALHVTAIGGVGGMTLAMMSRATLGHTGRPLIAPYGIALSYALLPLAAALRWVASAFPAEFYFTGVLGSALVWTFAFALYLAALWPAFWLPRLPRMETSR